MKRLKRLSKITPLPVLVGSVVLLSCTVIITAWNQPPVIPAKQPAVVRPVVQAVAPAPTKAEMHNVLAGFLASEVNKLVPGVHFKPTVKEGGWGLQVSDDAGTTFSINKTEGATVTNLKVERSN